MDIAIYLLQSIFIIYSYYLYFFLRKTLSTTAKRLSIHKTTPGSYILLYRNGSITVSNSALGLLSPSATLSSLSDLRHYLPKEEIDALKQLSKSPYTPKQQHCGEIHVSTPGKAENYLRYTAIRSKLKHMAKCTVVIWLFECTEAKQQELSLIKYLNKYRLFSFELDLLLNSLPMAVWRREDDMSIVMRSKGYKNLLLQAGYPEDIESFTDAEDYMLKKLDAKRYNELTYKKNLTISGRATLLKFVEIPTPNVGGTVGYAMEIPELSKLEDKTLTLQTTLDTILDTFPQGILIINNNGNVEAANRAFIKIFSIDESLLERHISFSSLIDKMQESGSLPETKNYKNLKEEYLDLLDPNNPRTIFHMHLPNNTTLRVSITGESGFNTILVYENVTELLNTERAYKDLLLSFRTAAETSINPMAIFGQDYKLKFYNQAFSSIFKEDVTQVLAGNPRFDKLISLLPTKTNIDDIVLEFDSAMHTREERVYTYYSQDNHVNKVFFKPLPNNTLLIRFYHLPSSETA